MGGKTSSVPPARPRAALIFPFLWVLTFDHNIWPRRAVLEASVSCRVKPGLGSRIRCGMGKKCKLLILQVMFLGAGNYFSDYWLSSGCPGESRARGIHLQVSSQHAARVYSLHATF